jgi:hypothetical protein
MKERKGKLDLRSRFKKRNQELLEKVYTDRETRSSFGRGRSIFNTELMEKFGIKEFRASDGDNFLEFLPLDFEGSEKYFREIAVHNSVGLNNDQYICMAREGGDKCFRCEYQKQLYRKADKPTDEIKALYPSDRAIYFVWNRTSEMSKDEDPVYEIGIWNSSKKMDHAEIQSLVRDKKKKTIIDISDVSEDGEGKTVYFKQTKRKTDFGTFPDHAGFELLDRDESIPEEILEKLEKIINAAEKNGENPIDMFLIFPNYEDLKEAMQSEVEASEGSKKESGKAGKKFGEHRKKPEQQKLDIDDIEAEIADLNKKKLIKWAVAKGIEDQIDEDMDDDEIREAIMEYYQELLGE